MSHTILLVEDNPYIMDINYEALMMEGYRVLKAEDGRGCMEMLKSEEVDLMVLDIMLPDADGLTLCKKIKNEYDIPIIFLSALGENEQIVDGLRAGGDDYLPKPYDIGVLLARIDARLRDLGRWKRFVRYKDLKLDSVSMIAYCGDNDILLTQKEFILLLSLARNINNPVGIEELYQNVWGTVSADDHNAIHTTVSRLNKKLDTAKSAVRVAFQRGEGYLLEEY